MERPDTLGGTVLVNTDSAIRVLRNVGYSVEPWIKLRPPDSEADID